MPEYTDTQTIVETAQRAVDPHELQPGLYSIVVPDDGEHVLIDLEKHDAHPRRKKGTVQAHDAATLVAYVEDHGLVETQVWADFPNTRIVAVLNAHEPVTELADEQPLNLGAAGWGDHRATFDVRKTPAWLAWAEHDGQWLDQTTFAEHIENRAIDIINPTGGEMLELAQSITGTLGGSFESSKRLSNGEVRLEYKETVQARAGQAGQLEIPSQIELALRPFEGADVYRVVARFRYRIHGGHLKLSYALERPEDTLREAFTDVVNAVEEGIAPRRVHRGVPA